MRKFFSKIITNKFGNFFILLTGVIFLLSLGFLIGWQSESFAFIHPTNIDYISKTGTLENTAVFHNNLTIDEIIFTEAFQFIILIGVITTLLIFWMFVLFFKSLRTQRVIKKTNKALELEKVKRKDTKNKLVITNQQLSSASGQLTGIIDGSTDLIVAIDSSYRYISFNKSFHSKIIELFNSDIKIGMTLDEALKNCPEDLRKAKLLWDRALKGEKFSAKQVFSVSLEKTYYFDLTYTPILNENGEVIGASQICRDITEQVLTTEKLKRERDFASAVFEANSSLIVVLDREGRIIRFNRACEECSGFKEEELRGRVFWNILIPTHEIAKVKNGFQQLEHDIPLTEYINNWVTKDERIRTISWFISTIKDENETNEYIVATGIDITEKRKFETSQQRMLEILENSSDFIRISDLQGRITYLNPAGRKMIGLNSETDISQLRVTNCHPKWANDLMKKTGYPDAAKKGSWLGETAIKTVDNDEIPSSQLILAHRNSNGHIECYSTVVREAKMVNGLVNNENAKAINYEYKSNHPSIELLAKTSHEIRTPMNGIIGITDLLNRTELTGEQKNLVKTVEQSGANLLSIIDEILDFSRLSSGKIKINKTEFNLNETIESILDLFSKRLNEKQIDISYLIKNDVPEFLFGDSVKLRQILINLIGNAIKFTAKGTIHIKIGLKTNSPQSELIFSIKDTGIGISREDGDNLFKPFVQADQTINSQYGGSGLGLTISKQMVEILDGEIGFTSKPGEGSIFWFTAKFDQHKISRRSLFTDSSLKNKKLLIVEESKIQADVIQYITKKWGLIADQVNGYNQAIKLIKRASLNNEPFDLILLNESSSKFNISDLSNKLTSDPAFRKSKILVCNFLDNDKTLEELDSNKSIECISLPLKHSVLFEKLNRFFSESYENNEKYKYSDPNSEIINKETPYFSKNIHTESPAKDKIFNILIAEDDLVTQKIIFQQVSQLGYSVEIVSNGQEVLEALERKEYSLILMDCKMPVLDGLATTIKIRQNEQSNSANIPIIATSAEPLEDIKDKYLQAGVDDFLLKPINQSDLANILDIWTNFSEESLFSEENKHSDRRLSDSALNIKEKEEIILRLNELEETLGTITVLDCLNLFINDSEKVIDYFKNIEEPFNYIEIATKAHKLKGSSSNMGAVRLPELCQKLNKFAQKKQKVSMVMIINQIVKEYGFLMDFYIHKKKFYAEEVNQITSAT